MPAKKVSKGVAQDKSSASPQSKVGEKRRKEAKKYESRLVGVKWKLVRKTNFII